MKARVVPHGESAAEFRPLLRHADWLLVPNPRAVPIAAEHLADALALGRGGVWPQFGGQTDDAPIRAARGRALEGAVESALRSALSAGTSSRHRIYRSVNHSTSIPRPGVKWSSGGEVDVLVGCGALQIAIECKAGDYDGRGVPPAKFVSEPIAQLTKWRTARQSDTLRFAADNNGRPFNDEEEAHLRALIRAPAALDVVLTLDDFGYMPTAAPLMFRVSRSEVDAGAAPIYMCLPDFVELCEVLRGRDLLTYLTVRAQLTHTDLPHHLPEDGCLALFLETGHISRLSQDEQDEVLKQASMDHEGLFAWKVQRQFTEHPTVPTPQPRRSEGLRELLNSLVRPGEEAEVAHIVAATILPGAIGSEQDATDRIRRQKPSIFRNPTGQTLLIIDRLKGDLATWTRSEVFIEQALKAFRPGMAPKLVVVIHTTDRGSQIRVHGEVPVLVKSRVEAAALEEALIDGSALKRLENLALDRKAPCPCGSGLKHRKCRRMRKHRVPLPD